MADDLLLTEPEASAEVSTVPASEDVGAFSPGIVVDLPFEEYLKTGQVSKSTLWTLHKKSPKHARVDKEPSNAMKIGTAIHCAVLEPDEFRERFVRGPENRRGNRWKEALEEHGEKLLTSEDFDNALLIRDLINKEPMIKALISGGTLREVSAFAIDEPTGLQKRVRFDAYSPEFNMGIDLKTSKDITRDAFLRSVRNFGYHVQDPFYSETWGQATEEDLDAFAFLAVEIENPFDFQFYELDENTVAEGRAIMRAAMDSFARCLETNEWPGYPREVREIGLKKWDFELTEPDLEASDGPEEDFGDEDFDQAA